MPILHLAQVQLEVRRRPIAGMTIPPVGEQDAADIQEQRRVGIACFTWPPSAPSATCDGSFREQEYGGGSGTQAVGRSIFPDRFLPRGTQVLWRFPRRVNGQTPPSPRRYGGQTEIDRIGAGIEHSGTGRGAHLRGSDRQPVFPRVGPVRASSLRAKPMDLGIRVELFLAQHRMRRAKGDHAAGKPVNLLMLFKCVSSQPNWFRCPGSRRCCCRLGSGDLRPRRAASAPRARSIESPGSS